MKRYFKASTLTLLFFILFIGCKSTKEVIYLPTQINLQVLDDLDQPVKGALIKIFDDRQKYDSAKVNGQNKGEIISGASDNDGRFSIGDKKNDLNPDLIYYFLITYRDRSRFVDLNNFESQFKTPEELNRGSTNNITIKLSQAQNPVSFFVKPALDEYLPITVFIGQDSLNKPIEASVTSTPTQPGLAGTLNYKVNKGFTTWYATSPKGCYWEGSFNFSGTETFTPVEITPCEAGSVSFWTENMNSSRLPITIILNNGDTLAKLTNTLNQEPDECFQKNTVSAGRNKGTYSYLAKSNDGACIWTDTFSISPGVCKKINLPFCK